MARGMRKGEKVNGINGLWGPFGPDGHGYVPSPLGHYTAIETAI